MLRMVEKSIRAGIYHAVHRYLAMIRVENRHT